uniref:Uncharacterized protein n=1 Tax=Phocoena sinus TaxID=42100 RepID=A0A8C9DWC5_PHOSS
MKNVTGEPSTPGGPQPFLSGAQGSFPAEAGASPHPGLPSLHPLQGPHPQGVKKKTCTPNISRKIKEEPKEEVTVKKEKDTDRQREGHGQGGGCPEVFRSHSIFEQGPDDMMKKKGN